jgi:hypothetical protein
VATSGHSTSLTLELFLLHPVKYFTIFPTTKVSQPPIAIGASPHCLPNRAQIAAPKKFNRIIRRLP